MASLNGFDASTVEPAAAFEPVPAGKYTAVITESEMKPTKDGRGEYLQFTFQIADGEHKGRNLWARLNLKNASDVAVKIAQGELSGICRAVGVMTPKDSAELHNRPLTITVGVEKRKDTGDLSNVLKGYEPVSGKPKAAAATGGGAKPPWVK